MYATRPKKIISISVKTLIDKCTAGLAKKVGCVATSSHLHGNRKELEMLNEQKIQAPRIHHRLAAGEVHPHIISFAPDPHLK